jgi:hypothetical protein
MARSVQSNPFNLQPAKLRLQPKASSMRPIVNLSSRGVHGGDSPNFLLRPAFEVLRWELLHNGKAHMLGASVFNLIEAYDRLLPFILWCKRNAHRRLYFVSVDVKQSFDSINQDKLCSILFGGSHPPILESDRYYLQRYVSYCDPCEVLTWFVAPKAIPLACLVWGTSHPPFGTWSCPRRLCSRSSKRCRTF